MSSSNYGSTKQKGSTPSSRAQASVNIQNDAELSDEENPQPKKIKKPLTSSAPPAQKKTSPVTLYTILGLFVFCGTCSTVLGKVLFQSRSVGLEGYEKPFQKPLMQNTGMFVGMTLCLVVFEFNRRLCVVKQNSETRPLLRKGEEPAADYRVYYVVLVPALCDFVATYMMNVGLLWINASIVLFAALIRWIWLGRKIKNYQWFGIVVVMSALGIIGLSCILNETTNAPPVPSHHTEAPISIEHVTTDSERALGVFLVLAAQLVQATQTVVEEHLLHDVRAEDMQIVGLEGIWGLVLCVAVAMPVAEWLSVSGLHEDTWDTLAMMRNSGQIMFLFTLYVIVILGYNIMAMKTTMYLNSVTRNIIDTIRTIFIWTTLTVVHYTIDPSLGENWSKWSFMQLGGFLVLITGLFTYYNVFSLPCFDYTEEPVPPPKEPTPKIPAAVMHSPYMSPKL